MPKFTFDTPNLFIYLGALLRPTNVRPHLRVPSRSYHSIYEIQMDVLEQMELKVTVRYRQCRLCQAQESRFQRRRHRQG
jgi:hypothetical protein